MSKLSFKMAPPRSLPRREYDTPAMVIGIIIAFLLGITLGFLIFLMVPAVPAVCL